MHAMEEEPILRAGYRLDRYELLCPIASGGMAAVWLAQLRGKRGFEKLFAIKTIKTELTDDARFQEMFLDEARIASGIEHPNVAHIVDLGEQGSILYIVMEWVDGESLAKVSKLARKHGTPLPLGLTLRIMADACAGLHAAHELRDPKGENLGVVHRDVSPQNILVTSTGAVKVIDFGVAKARNRRAGETGEGVVKGKIRYMAPEQVRNQDVDRRADIWAIGVCLQELATGAVPFESESDIGVLRRLMSEELPPQVSDDVPGPVRDILARSVARDPAERFETAAAMRRAIENTIVKLGLDAASDDVAEFLRTELPGLETKRREVVTKALSGIGTRQSLSGEGSVSDEVAFAATVVSKAKDDADAVPLTRKAQHGPSARAVLSGEVTPDDSKVTRTSFTDEAAGLPKNRGYYAFFLLVALCAGAWFGWPGAARIKATVARFRATPAAPAPVADPVIPSASSSVPAVASASPGTDAATPSASVSASAASSASSAPHVGAVPGIRPTATASASATATTRVPWPAPTTAPTDSTDEPY